MGEFSEAGAELLIMAVDEEEEATNLAKYQNCGL